MQRPLATVVIGGLITSTLLTGLVVPALSVVFSTKRKQPIEIFGKRRRGRTPRLRLADAFGPDCAHTERGFHACRGAHLRPNGVDLPLAQLSDKTCH